MTPDLALELYIRPALSILPNEMSGQEAQAMLVAIGLQESRFKFREQVRGPARGYWQFELGGLNGVLKHHATSAHSERLVTLLEYSQASPVSLHGALACDQILAAGIARLLLWSSPAPLPRSDMQEAAWRYYLNQWRPGKPHPGTWAQCWSTAWEIIE